MIDYDCVVIGAGLSGLAAAKALRDNEKSVLLIEKNSHVGGRLRSFWNSKWGLPLDEGFQVFLSSYDTAGSIFNDTVPMVEFLSGSRLVLEFDRQKKTTAIMNPLFHPLQFAKSLKESPFSAYDLVLLSKLFLSLQFLSQQAIFSSEDRVSTRQWLEDYGFSQEAISCFFQPFFGGVFLENELNTDARLFRFLFKCFQLGRACVPKGGIQDLALYLLNQLQSNSNSGEFLLKTSTTGLTEGNGIVRLVEENKKIRCHKIIETQSSNPRPFRSVQNFYVECPRFESTDPILYLFAEKSSCIQNLHSHSALHGVSEVPNSPHLLSVTSLKSDVDLSDKILSELCVNFGYQKSELKIIEKFAIPMALPKSTPEWLPSELAIPRGQFGQHLCGDSVWFGSIESSIQIGLEAAKSALSSNS